MVSLRYRQMQSQIGKLRQALIPMVRRGAATLPTPRISIRALSYRVLCHAEIEHYLEDRVLEIAVAAKSAWENRKHVSKTTLCLLGFSGLEMQLPPNSFAAPPKDRQKDWQRYIHPNDRLERAINAYVQRVRVDNHGIREANLTSMLIPIGFSANDIDDLLVIEMNEFATKRGSAAHLSVGGYVRQGVSPTEEVNQVARIVNGLKSVDEQLSKLLRAAS